MISGKDITIDKDGNIILNGDKHPLASQAEIDAVKDDIDEIEEKLEKTFTLDSGTVIPDNSDLNDYKTPGNYYHLTANVGTISNIPINKGFRLTVLLDLKDAGFVEQLFNPIGTYTLYKRYLSGGTTWSDWAVVEDNIGDLTQTGVSGASVAAQLGALDTDKQDTLTFDDAPTENSTNPVTSGGVYTALTPLGLFDIQEYTAASPGTGTSAEKATRVITDVLTHITLTKNFTAVNVSYDTAYRGEMLISAAASSFNYSIGLYFSYYTDEVYTFTNNNGTVTVRTLTAA